MYAFSILASESSSGSGLSFLIFPLAIGAVMYFLMIRPQRKRIKAQAALQSSIGVGDEVVTNSGIYGFITGEEGDRFWLEIDDDVQIRIARAAIQGKVSNDAGPSTKPDSSTSSASPGDDEGETSDES